MNLRCLFGGHDWRVQKSPAGFGWGLAHGGQYTITGCGTRVECARCSARGEVCYQRMHANEAWKRKVDDPKWEPRPSYGTGRGTVTGGPTSAEIDALLGWGTS